MEEVRAAPPNWEGGWLILEVYGRRWGRRGGRGTYEAGGEGHGCVRVWREMRSSLEIDARWMDGRRGAQGLGHLWAEGLFEAEGRKAMGSLVGSCERAIVAGMRFRKQR